MQHRDLIACAQALGYTIFKNGLCKGFSSMWAQAVLAGDETTFYQRLLLIADTIDCENGITLLKENLEYCQSRVKQGQLLTDEELSVLELLPFFDGMALYLSPEVYSDLLNQPYVAPSNIPAIYPFTQSQRLHNINVSMVLEKSYCFDKPLLKTFFDELAEIVSQSTVAMPIILDSIEHSVCMKYNPITQRWIYINTNFLIRYEQNQYIEFELTTEKLVDAVFDSFYASPIDPLKKAIFTTTILATHPTPQVKQRLAILDSKYPLQAGQALASDAFNAGLLHFACLLGNASLVKGLLEEKAEINQATVKGITPFLCACLNGDLDIAQALLDKNADINIVAKMWDEKEVTPIFAACKNGHLIIVDTLLKSGKITQGFREIFTPLPSERCKAIFETCQYNIHTLIHSIEDLMKAHQQLSPEQFSLVFAKIKDKLPEFIKTAADLTSIQSHHLTEEQYKDILLVFKNTILHSTADYLTAAQSFAFPPKMLFEVCKERLPDLIHSVDDYSQIAKCLSPYSREASIAFYQKCRNKLARFTHTIEDFFTVLDLSGLNWDERGEEAYQTFKNKPRHTINSISEFVKIIGYNSLSDRQSNDLFETYKAECVDLIQTEDDLIPFLSRFKLRDSRTALVEAIHERLPYLINSLNCLKLIYQSLPITQHEPILLAIKEKLPTMIGRQAYPSWLLSDKISSSCKRNVMEILKNYLPNMIHSSDDFSNVVCAEDAEQSTDLITCMYDKLPDLLKNHTDFLNLIWKRSPIQYQLIIKRCKETLLGLIKEPDDFVELLLCETGHLKDRLVNVQEFLNLFSNAELTPLFQLEALQAAIQSNTELRNVIKAACRIRFSVTTSLQGALSEQSLSNYQSTLPFFEQPLPSGYTNTPLARDTLSK